MVRKLPARGRELRRGGFAALSIEIPEGEAALWAAEPKTKGHPFGCPFVLGSAAQRAAPPFGISMLGGNEFRLRRGFACGKTPARRKGATGQKGRLGGSPIPFQDFKRSILTTPSTKRARRKPCPFLWTPRAEGLLRPSTRLVRHIGGRWLEGRKIECEGINAQCEAALGVCRLRIQIKTKSRSFPARLLLDCRGGRDGDI